MFIFCVCLGNTVPLSSLRLKSNNSGTKKHFEIEKDQQIFMENFNVGVFMGLLLIINLNVMIGERRSLHIFNISVYETVALLNESLGDI